MKTIQLSILWLCMATGIIHAQEAVSLNSRGIINAMQFDTAKSYTRAEVFYRLLQLDNANAFTVVDSFQVTPSLTSIRIKQTYKNIPVEGANMLLHYANGKLLSFKGHYVPVSQLNTTPAISAEAARQICGKYYQMADSLSQNLWVEQVIMENPDTAALSPALLCQKVYGNDRALYINAATGAIVAELPLSASFMDEDPPIATLHTLNYGVQHVENTLWGSTYRLNNFDLILYKGSYSYMFGDNDNIWYLDEYEHLEEAHAHDVFYVLNATAEFFRALGWNGYDNRGSRLTVVVDYTGIYNGAAWFSRYNGSRSAPPPQVEESPAILVGIAMAAYGYRPPVTFDILSHEFGHGFDSYTSGFIPCLSSCHERFGIAEGIADIWGTIVEAHYAPDKERWKSGEDVVPSEHSCIRNIAEPNDPLAEKCIASFYKDSYYNTLTDPHLIGGVCSHWFYLLVEGRHNNSCSDINGIGMEKAAQLIYTAQRSFLAAGFIFDDFTYHQLREGILEAACVLWGENSAEVEAIKKAWDAVGVYDTSLEVGTGNVLDYHVSGSELWNSKKYLRRVVYIPQGATLTITDTVYCFDNAEIIVEPGGRLVINGGTLTNTCDNRMWQG
ncbi:MAG: M4 family metallopeptidase, partial [Bacteroidales bacterium]|nr:M4 family metallopeptidase [Bacteroidales bacterium]